MSEPLRFYLETSVWSRVVDRKEPFRRRATRRFLSWADRRHHFLASHLVIVELRRTPHLETRKRMMRAMDAYRVRHLQYPATRLRRVAYELIALGCVTAKHLADAYHLAYAVLGRVDAVVTWNMADLARAHTREVLRDYCWRYGIPEIRIGNPSEVAGWLDVEIP